MATGIKGLTESIMSTIDNHGNKETRPYDVKAQVRNIDGNTAYVHIPGGVDETPVDLTLNANIGDWVQVRISGGRAWITGNASAPPTDDTRANAAFTVATDASELSTIAARAAENAQVSAIKAEEEAIKAGDSATRADKEAQRANKAADEAIDGLSLLQRVVDVANWIAEHGKYEVTTDTTPVNGKFYFLYNDASQTYSIVEPQEGDNPSEKGWYEITSIDDSITNFVVTHMALVDDALILKNGNNRVDLSTTEGVVLYANGKRVASYGVGSVIGPPDGFHVEIFSNEIGFYNGPTTKVAYINGQKLYITKSVVLQQMDVGRPVGDVDPVTGEVGKGQWSWKVHDINGKNNLYLKWLG